MVTKPEIAWIGVHPENYARGRGGVALEAIVIHIAEGTMAGIDSWFNDPRARASTHFAVSKAGAIHQYVDLADMAYGHGAVEAGYTAKLVDINAGLNPNQWAVGIEHEGRSGDRMTPAQFDASTRLAVWLFAEVLMVSGATDVRIDRDHVLRHGEISPRSRSRCPGYPEADLQGYVARVRELVEGMTPTVDWRALYEAELRGQLAAAEDDGERAAERIETVKRKLSELPRL